MAEDGEIEPPPGPWWYVPNCIAEGRLEDHQIPDNFYAQRDEFYRLRNLHNYLLEGWSECMENMRQNGCCVTTSPILPIPPMCPETPFMSRYSGVTIVGSPAFGGTIDANKVAKGEIYPWGGIITLNGIRADYHLCIPRAPADPNDPPRERNPKPPPCPPLTKECPPPPWELYGPAERDQCVGDDETMCSSED